MSAPAHHHPRPSPRRFRALALCVFLITACGDDTGTTPPDIPDDSGPDTTAPATIANLDARSPTSRSVALVFTAPGDDGDEGRAAAYDVRYDTKPFTPEDWDDLDQMEGEPDPLAAGDIETFRVLGLLGASDYYFAIKTGDESGNWSEVSNVASATTLSELTPPAAVSDLTALAVSETSVQLVWTATGDDGFQGTASSYDIRYATSPITEDNWASAARVGATPIPLPAGSEQLYIAEDLDPVLIKDFFFVAMKVADEIPNTSPISNSAPALGYSQNLWRLPREGANEKGDMITLYYRAPENGRTKLRATHNIHYESCADEAGFTAFIFRNDEWDGVPCREAGGNAPCDVVLLNRFLEPGVHTMSYDFTEPGTGDYLKGGLYILSLCWELD